MTKYLPFLFLLIKCVVLVQLWNKTLHFKHKFLGSIYGEAFFPFWIFFMWFLFCFFSSPFSFVTSENKTIGLWTCFKAVNRFCLRAPPVLPIHSSAFLSSHLDLHDNCMSLLLIISCKEWALVLFIISVTLKELDEGLLFRSSLSLSRYWTWRINEDLFSRKFAEVHRKRNAVQGDNLQGCTG